MESISKEYNKSYVLDCNVSELEKLDQEFEEVDAQLNPLYLKYKQEGLSKKETEKYSGLRLRLIEICSSIDILLRS